MFPRTSSALRIVDHSVSIGINSPTGRERCQGAIARAFAHPRIVPLLPKVCLITEVCSRLISHGTCTHRWWYDGGTVPLVPAKGSKRSDGTIARDPPPGSSSYINVDVPFDFLRRLPSAGRGVSSIGRSADRGAFLEGWSEELLDKGVERAQDVGGEQRIRLLRLPSLRTWQHDEYREHRQSGHSAFEILSEDCFQIESFARHR